MRTNGVEAAIARYREAGKKRCVQLELRANGERVLGGFTVQIFIRTTHLEYITLTMRH